MKSIYSQDTLRCNQAGLDVKMEASNWFRSMLEKYPDHNPREIAALCSGEFDMAASRQILNLRRNGVLVEHKHISGQICPAGIDCQSVRCQNHRAALEEKTPA